MHIRTRLRAKHPVQPPLNTHMTLAVAAVCISCFTGFFTIPLSLASLIFSLRAKDMLLQAHTQEAAGA